MTSASSPSTVSLGILRTTPDRQKNSAFLQGSEAFAKQKMASLTSQGSMQAKSEFSQSQATLPTYCPQKGLTMSVWMRAAHFILISNSPSKLMATLDPSQFGERIFFVETGSLFRASRRLILRTLVPRAGVIPRRRPLDRDLINADREKLGIDPIIP